MFASNWVFKPGRALKVLATRLTTDRDLESGLSTIM